MEDAFILYLKPSKNRTPQGTPNCQRKIFEDAFGEDLSKIEADWRAHVKRLGAPNPTFVVGAPAT